MAGGLATLTQAQRSMFEAEQRRLRLRPDQLCHEGGLQTKDYGGRLVFSTDPAKSHVQPIVVPYHSMAELKMLRGIPDEHYASKLYSDRHISYPEPLKNERAKFLLNTKNICDLRHHLAEDEKALLMQAAEAYMLGFSPKVKDHEELLNASLTPGVMHAFAGDSLVVNAGQVFEITSPDPSTPVTLNYGSITVESGGQIKISCMVSITTQTFATED